MALLADTITTPPGGWRYVQAETGCVMTEGSFVRLVEKVIEHRQYKKLEPADSMGVGIDVQRQICQGLEPRFCRAEPGEKYTPTEDQTMDFSSEKGIAFSTTVFETIKAGHLVDKAESARRAAICRGCQFNKSAGVCACSLFYAAVELIVPRDRIEQGLRICAACGCSLKAKVLAPIEAVRAGNEGRSINFPAHCWQKV